MITGIMPELLGLTVVSALRLWSTALGPKSSGDGSRSPGIIRSDIERFPCTFGTLASTCVEPTYRAFGAG